jgi:hypothetical protein
MAKDGLLTFVCAAATLCLTPSWGRSSPVDDHFLSETLAVQSAMQQAREHLLHNRPEEAVAVLHRELSHINGNPVYLALLRDAYQACIKELRLAHKDAEAEPYVKWLNILEPKSSKERGGNAPTPKAKTAVLPAKESNNLKLAVAPAKPQPTVVRGSIDEDPFNDSPSIQERKAKELLQRAEQEFSSHRFMDAGKLFEQAHQADTKCTDASRERWAYCKLFHVVEQLNLANGPKIPDADLEKEVSDALVLAPRLDYGRQLMNEIRQRRRGSDAAVIEFHDLGRIPQGWLVGETTNFRIYYVQSPELARKVAETAEQTRTRMYNKWFGHVAPEWNPKCQIFLYPTSQDYSRGTTAPVSSPGHSSSVSDGGRVVARQIDLHCEDPATMLSAVLPHETTHVVLVGNFGDHVVPRWVDEGIAVLTEPHDKVMRYLVKLPGLHRNRQLLEIRQLVQMDNHPDDVFYAESASLVEFLSKQKGPEAFTLFVRDGLQDGYETALQRFYGYQSLAELQQHWLQYAFGNRNATFSTTSRIP